MSPAGVLRWGAFGKALGGFLTDPRALLWEFQSLAGYRRFRRRYPFLADGMRVSDPSRRVLILNLNTGQFKAQLSSVLSTALRQRGLTPVVVTYRWCTKARRYYEAFGIKDFVDFEERGFFRGLARLMGLGAMIAKDDDKSNQSHEQARL